MRRSQEKELTVAQILLSTHQVLVEIREAVRSLDSRVASLEASFGGAAASRLLPVSISSGEETEVEEDEDEEMGEVLERPKGRSARTGLEDVPASPSDEEL